MNPILYRKETLEAIARSVISKHNPYLLNEPSPIPVETIIEKECGLTLEFQFIRNNGRVLGKTVFEDTMVPIYEREGQEGYKLVPVKAGTVIIDASLLNCHSGDGRFRYTCAHELAHWLIHKDFFTGSEKPAAMLKAANSPDTNIIIERQADWLGSYLLMPKGTVKKAFHRSRNKTNDVVTDLAQQFCVSRQAMEIRLTEMRLLS